MTRRLQSGLYEELLTSALEAEIDARTAEGWWVDVGSADATVRPEFLARHVYQLLRRALEGISRRRWHSIRQPDRPREPAGGGALRTWRDGRRPGRGRCTPASGSCRTPRSGRYACACPSPNALSPSDRASRQWTARCPDRERDCAGDPKRRSDRFSCARSCVTQGCVCSAPSLKNGCGREHRCA